MVEFIPALRNAEVSLTKITKDHQTSNYKIHKHYIGSKLDYQLQVKKYAVIILTSLQRITTACLDVITQAGNLQCGSRHLLSRRLSRRGQTRRCSPLLAVSHPLLASQCQQRFSKSFRYQTVLEVLKRSPPQHAEK